MDERVLRFRVGVVVVAAAIITIILITLLGAWPSPFKSRKTVQVEFDSAPGVTVDTPVRKSGIQIGRVSDLELRDNGTVLLTLKIDDKYRLTMDQVCRISMGSMVTGDAVLEWVHSDAKASESAKEIMDGDYLSIEEQYSEVAPDLLSMISRFEGKIDSALNSIDGAGQEVKKVAQTLNSVLGPDELEPLVKQMLLAMQNFNTVMADIQEITGDEELKTRLRGTVQRLPELFANAEKTLTEVQTTLGKFNGVAVRAERNLANLEDFTAPLGEKGEEISQNLVESIRSVNDLLGNLAQLSTALNNEDGTVGQLINNPELYNRVNRTLMEIEKLVRKVEPILDDARVISDKIARDPAQMGVRGIRDNRMPGMGQKFPTNFLQSKQR